MAMNRYVVKKLMRECAEGNLDTEKVLFAALRKLDELGENIVYDLAIEHEFFIPEDFVPESDDVDLLKKRLMQMLN